MTVPNDVTESGVVVPGADGPRDCVWSGQPTLRELLGFSFPQLNLISVVADACIEYG